MYKTSFFLIVLVLISSCHQHEIKLTSKDYELIPYNDSNRLLVTYNEEGVNKLNFFTFKSKEIKNHTEVSSGVSYLYEECYVTLINKDQIQDNYITLNILHQHDIKMLSFDFSLGTYIRSFKINNIFELDKLECPFFNNLTIDNKDYQNVYMVPNDNDTLYYSSKSGLIKLVAQTQTYRFELK